MNIKELLKYYGSELNVAFAVRKHPQTVKNWVNENRIPQSAQMAIQFLTKGKFKADEIR